MILLSVLPCEICLWKKYNQHVSPFCFKDLDNSDANERLKFSILKRLPEVCSRVCGQTLALFFLKKMQVQEQY